MATQAIEQPLAASNAAGSPPISVDRFASLDAIRGVAVMGILAMNIVAFAMPMTAYFNPAAFGGDSGIDLAAWFFNFVLVDSKMRALFSILFGASTLLVIQRAMAGERSAAGAHYSRMLWLLVFGLAHFYLIWFGDILILYALCGLILFAFRNLSVKALTIWAVALITLQTLYYSMISLGMLAAQSGAIPPESAEGLQAAIREIGASFGTDQSLVTRDLAVYGSGYADIVGLRTSEFLWMPVMGFLQGVLDTLGLMLIGMALYKSRMLTGEWLRRRYAKWALVCFAIALPVVVALALYQIASGFDGIAVFAASIAFSLPFDILMAVGWAALIMWLIGRASGSTFVAHLAAAGRMAFSNYLGTSIVMTTIFYGYGLGLFGEVSRAALYLFVIGMWAIILAWSKPWLERFEYGPLEWLWRSLARMKLQPMRRLSTSPIANH